MVYSYLLLASIGKSLSDVELANKIEYWNILALPFECRRNSLTSHRLGVGAVRT